MLQTLMIIYAHWMTSPWCCRMQERTLQQASSLPPDPPDATGTTGRRTHPSVSFSVLFSSHFWENPQRTNVLPWCRWPQMATLRTSSGLVMSPARNSLL